MNETLNMQGRLTLRMTGLDGGLIEEREYSNRIVTAGRLLVAQLFAGIPGGTPPSKVTHMAVGTNADAAADGQNGLGAERAPRKEITDVTFSELTDETGARRVKASLKAVFDFADANDPAAPLREAGIFTASAAGTMYNRVIFEPVTKTDAFKLTLLWDITF